MFQLLELPQFQDNIIKIKTIGSTYMAASGLNPSRIVRVCIFLQTFKEKDSNPTFLFEWLLTRFKNFKYLLTQFFRKHS